ncbi:MAG TPA: MerR family transcriptional regulator [Trebonia sp.]|jgi:DNA-binding transcriptional MerR regulator|nr:MerR family transcriptional regulator [Trebonia sp.]
MSELGRPIFSISAVARTLGLPIATIRTWEDRYGLVVPHRNASGHRLYRRDEVEQLRFVQACMADGTSAADAHRLLAERIDAAVLEPAHRTRPLILLADHDRFSAEYQERLLQSEGFDVQVALSDEELQKSFVEMSPSLVVVELLVSGGTGLDLCRFCKSHGRAPVVVVSVLQAHDLAFDAGADAFLLKPLEPSRLASTVRDLLGSGAALEPEPEPMP